MNKEMLNLLAEIGTGGSLESRLTNWAIKKLLDGKETPSVALLAGLSQNELGNAVELFLKAAKELGYTVPSRDELLKAFIYKEVVIIAKEFLDNNIDIIKASELISSYKADLDPEWDDNDLTSFWVISDDFSNKNAHPESMEEDNRQEQLKAKEELLEICTPNAVKAAKNIVQKYSELLQL